MSKVTDILVTRLRQSVEEFLNELVDMFPHESEFAIAKIMVATAIPPLTIMENLAQGLTPAIQENIRQRHASFFIQRDLFGFNTLRLGEIWAMSMSEEEQMGVWAWVDHFVDLVNKYNDCLKKEN